MTAFLRQIDHNEVLKIVRSILIKTISPEHDFDQLAVDCALLRNYLWILSNKGMEPTYVTKLLNMAIEVETDKIGTLEIAEKSRRERLREALNELANSLDVIELANGRWLPAPVRLVNINNYTTEYLLIGGVPTNLLPDDIANEIISNGPFRRVKGDNLLKVLELPTEPLISWLNKPSKNLLEWSKEVIENTKLTAVQPKDSSKFQVYSQKTENLQAYRWVENNQITKNGKYLARYRSFMGLEYRIIETKDSIITKSGVPVFGFGDPRRLMYGIDALNNNPIRISVEENTDAFYITVRSELPRAENRLFAALGKLSLPKDTYYPRSWSFNKRDFDQIKQALENLKVKIDLRRS